MKNKTYLYGNFACKTDIGKVRMTNEDRAGAYTNAKGNILLIVCDGMGGQNKGEYAAQLALDVISESFLNKQKFLSSFAAVNWMYAVAKEANKKIYDEASENPKYNGMGTTLSMALIYKDTIYTLQIGDSRIYELRNHVLEQLTEDQTYVNYLYKTGKITKEEMKTHPKRHVLINALGLFPSVEFDFQKRPYLNSTILVCSDGLYNNVNKNDITAILKNDDLPNQKANELIVLANSNGGSDNIAVSIWEAEK
ncbi:MAG: Stp1/IreP family PP2C-type Ser/Thr phosphatase [Bacilli bacterium]|nr:Stp1/IreP family PP2C-type Ser/Thr phosphatase [Bacilli bacterium]